MYDYVDFDIDVEVVDRDVCFQDNRGRLASRFVFLILRVCAQGVCGDGELIQQGLAQKD